MTPRTEMIAVPDTATVDDVLEVIAAYKRACNRDLPYEITARRPGDVPVYVAQADKAAEVLGFRTEKTLDDMCASSWAWISGPHSGAEA